MDLVFPYLQCFDDLEQLDLFGVYQSQQSKTLSVNLQRCYGQPYCKSEKEINKFIDSHFISILYNDETYYPNKFGDGETFEKLLKIRSIPIEYETKETTVNSLQKQTLQSEADFQHSVFNPEEKEWYKLILADEKNSILKYENMTAI